MSITKLSPNWACQMGPIHCPKFLLPGERSQPNLGQTMWSSGQKGIEQSGPLALDAAQLIGRPFQAVGPATEKSFPVSTGILPHSLPEWTFRARPGLWRVCLCPKVARIAEQKFGSR